MKNTETTLPREDIKSDFITIASHQLRTPIAAIRWSLDTLINDKKERLSDRQKEVVLEAYHNNAFLLKSVNDLLRAARIEERGISLAPTKVSVTKIIQEFVKRNGNFLEANNCTVTFSSPPGLPQAYIDELQVKPIIEGLIDNSIKYSRGAGKIHITVKKIKNQLEVAVKDKGIGIPKDQQRLIFSRFFRARNAVKTQTEGLGLDLYIAKKIIEASGGKISFSSVEHKGSTFKLFLPTAAAGPRVAPRVVPQSPRVDQNTDDVLKKEREFVSITVHELKAPLGATKWSLEMLKNQKVGRLNADQLELIDQIYRGNERLLVLVRDLLDLAKLQQGNFDVALQPLAMSVVIKDVVNGFRHEAAKKQITIALPAAKSLPKVSGDPNRIAQVVTNIVSNAIKYTPEKGRVTITVKTLTGSALKKIGMNTATADLVHTDAKKGYVVLSVADTGIGISKEEQKKLFTRFFRAKGVLQSKAEGTGLGLYITKTIVTRHGGDIWFTSQPGQGSTFYFSLPIA